jgi:hypothetical protein
LKLTSAKSRQIKFASNISPSSQATYTKEKKQTTTTTTLDLDQKLRVSHTKKIKDDEHDSQNLKSSSIYINHHRHHHHHGGYEDCRQNNNNTLDFNIKPQASKQKRRSEYPTQIEEKIEEYGERIRRFLSPLLFSG